MIPIGHLIVEYQGRKVELSSIAVLAGKQIHPFDRRSIPDIQSALREAGIESLSSGFMIEYDPDKGE